MMGDTEGTFRIIYRDRADSKGNDISLDFGSITSIRSSINKAISTIPLVSMGADRAFQLETGSTLQYNISFKRKNPDEVDNSSGDSTKWSNAYWYLQVTKLIDRWQMRTDGCRMKYEPSITNPYVPELDVNGYIKMLSRSYNNKFNELIEGTIQFIVGTMYVLSSMKNQVPDQKKYKTLILKSGVTDNTDKKRYFLADVIYSIPDDQNKLILPPTPPAWTMYSMAKGESVSKWTRTGATSWLVGGELGLNNLGNVITLTAIWGDNDET